jgi:O-antigen/teichoic acid export membrane protein
LRGLVLSTGMGVVVSGVLSWRAVRGIDSGFRFDFSAIDRGLLRRLLRFSFALQITNLGSFLHFQLDKILLAHFATFAIVTRYELAARLTVAAWAIPYLLLQPLVPAVSELNSQDGAERIARLYRRASRYLAGIALPIAAFVIACAPGIVTLWLGPGYREVAVTTVFMIVFMTIVTATGVGTAICRGIGEPWIEARYHVVGAVTHIGLSMWLIPKYGLRGSLIALVASGAISTAFFLVQLHARLRESTPRWLVATTGVPLAVSVLAGAALVPWASGWEHPFAGRGASLRVAVAGVAFGVAVVATYFTTRYITWKELRELVPALRSRADRE